MSTANHGNFDIVIEANANAITRVANALLGPRVPSSKALPAGGAVQGELRPRIRVAATTFPSRPEIQLALDITGTELNISQVQLGTTPPMNIPNGSGLVPLDGTITIRDSLEIRSGALIVDFTSIPGGEPIIEPNFNEARLFSNPLIILYMAARALQGVTPDLAREEVRNMLNETARSFVRDLLQNQVRMITVVPSTSLMAVQDFRTTPSSVAALCGVRNSGSAGNRNLITRSILRRNSSGTFIDQTAFCVSNTSLLRDFIRGALTTPLGLTPEHFTQDHPFRWTGAVPIPGVALTSVALVSSLNLTFITAGIDEAGLLQVRGTAMAIGFADAFRLTVNIAMAFAIIPTTDGVTLTLTPTLVGSPIVRSDVSIASWVYIAAILSGGVGLGAILATIDLFAGIFLNGPFSSVISTAVSGAVPPIAIPISGSGLAPIVTSVSSGSLNQTDAVPRMFITPGTGLAVADGFKQHDLIVTMA